MREQNPFKEMKKLPKQTKNEASFIEKARGETQTQKEAKKHKTIYVSESLSKRLDIYIQTKARRQESQNFIITQALDEWLERRGN